MPDYIAHYIKAGHPDIHIDELRNLAGHEHHKVRLRVAEHESTPHDVLVILASDEHPDVQLAVAEHPNTSEEILRSLLSTASVDVLYAMAENPNLSAAILQALAEHDHPYISYRAQRTLKSLTGSPPERLNGSATNGRGSRSII
jgi:hypothetical protein